MLRADDTQRFQSRRYAINQTFKFPPKICRTLLVRCGARIWSEERASVLRAMDSDSTANRRLVGKTTASLVVAAPSHPMLWCQRHSPAACRPLGHRPHRTGFRV